MKLLNEYGVTPIAMLMAVLGVVYTMIVLNTCFINSAVILAVIQK